MRTIVLRLPILTFSNILRRKILHLRHKLQKKKSDSSPLPSQRSEQTSSPIGKKSLLLEVFSRIQNADSLNENS